MFVRLVRLFLAVLGLTGCSWLLKPVAEFCPSRLDTSHQFYGQEKADHLVVFIHGLCGDSKDTWTNGSTQFVFPEMLAQDFAKENQSVYIASFDYVSRLHGGPSILSVADHLEFEIGELLKKHSYRTLRIVAHSMGGLVAREYILRRHPRAHSHMKITNLVLLATPNNGSELAELGRLVSESRQIEELRHIDKGNTYLESLNADWNREFKGGGHPRHVLMFAGYEELSMPMVGQVVKLSSAISYADETLGFQQDHISISKPKSEKDVVYRWVKSKLSESLESVARKLLDGMVKQDLLGAADIPQRLPRTVELLEGLQELAGTELDRVLQNVKAGDFQAALALLSESESKENRLIEGMARRRFAMGQIYELQFNAAEAMSHYREAVRLDPGVAYYHLRYGWSLLYTGDARRAIPQFEESLELSRTSRNSYHEAAALDGLGVAHRDLNEYTKAIEYHSQALDITGMSGYLRGQAYSLGNLGIVYDKLGQYPQAIDRLEQTLLICRRMQDVKGEGDALHNLGNTYDKMGQYPKALASFAQALELHGRQNDLRGKGRALGGLGIVHFRLGQYDKAIEFYEQALEVSRQLGDVRQQRDILGNMASLHERRKEYGRAMDISREVLKISRAIHDKRGESYALGILGNVYAQLGQDERAIESYGEALAISREIKDLQGEGLILGYLGLVYGKLGQTGKAKELLEESRTILEKRVGIEFPFRDVLRLLEKTD